jgi:hypothetical protein
MSKVTSRRAPLDKQKIEVMATNKKRKTPTEEELEHKQDEVSNVTAGEDTTATKKQKNQPVQKGKEILQPESVMEEETKTVAVENQVKIIKDYGGKLILQVWDREEGEFGDPAVRFMVHEEVLAMASPVWKEQIEELNKHKDDPNGPTTLDLYEVDDETSVTALLDCIYPNQSLFSQDPTGVAWWYGSEEMLGMARLAYKLKIQKAQDVCVQWAKSKNTLYVAKEMDTITNGAVNLFITDFDEDTDLWDNLIKSLGDEPAEIAKNAADLSRPLLCKIIGYKLGE